MADGIRLDMVKSPKNRHLMAGANWIIASSVRRNGADLKPRIWEFPEGERVQVPPVLERSL